MNLLPVENFESLPNYYINIFRTALMFYRLGTSNRLIISNLLKNKKLM